MSDPLKLSELLELHFLVDLCHVPRLRPRLLGKKPSKDTSPRPWLRMASRDKVPLAGSHFRASQSRSKSVTWRMPQSVPQAKKPQKLEAFLWYSKSQPHLSYPVNTYANDISVKWSGSYYRRLHPAQHLTIKQPPSISFINIKAKRVSIAASLIRRGSGISVQVLWQIII